jgi:hypothetical protein
MFGVFVCEFRPRWPTQWLRSSTAMKSTFGFRGGSPANAGPPAATANILKKTRIIASLPLLPL